jgi:riboflavin synthase
VFTGIIEATAPIISKKNNQLVIARPEFFEDMPLGSSIAVSGVCLSVTAFDKKSMTFDVVQETWDKSKLGSLSEGDTINLERACLADSRLDGHVVQGHCEGVGSVKRKTENGKLTIRVPKELIKFFVQKGSIALDGVSLTIAAITETQITVALVPLTIENTTLGFCKEGDAINIETDIVGRYLYAFTHEEAALQR